MYWAIDSTALFGGILGGSGPPNQFDAADLADLNTVRSTVIPVEVLPWAALGASLIGAALVAWIGARRRVRSE
jgi:hypothetical protein